MKLQLVTFFDVLRTSYWFIPALMSVLAFALAVLVLFLDAQFEKELPRDGWWLYGGDHAGARTLVGVVVSTMISVTSVVFSITIVTLTLAAGQFGSRILRNFMRDRGNQVTLGTFIATFVFALIVLRTVPGEASESLAPSLSVTVTMVLAFISVGVLIYFIHHVASSIQADSVIRSIAQELHGAIARLFPDELGQDQDAAEMKTGPVQLPKDFDDRSVPLLAEQDDYLQAIDQEELLVWAQECDCIIRLEHRPGDFVVHNAILARIWSASGNDVDLTSLRRFFIFGQSRTLNQDAEFGILQLVEIAVRALSPGINDPFTATTCIDRLAASLCQLARRKLPDPIRYDEQGKVRVLVDTTDFVGFVNAALNQIRQNASDSAAVLIRLLEAIGIVGDQAQTRAQREVLQQHADMVFNAGLEALAAKPDLNDLREQYTRTCNRLRRRQ